MKRKLFSLGLTAVLLLTTVIPAAAADSAPLGDTTASADNFNAAEFEEVSEMPMDVKNSEDEGALTSEEGTAEAPNEKAEKEGMDFLVEDEEQEAALIGGAEEMALLMGEIETPTISVVNGNGSFEIFPYKIDASGEVTDEQLTSGVYYVKSTSTKDIDLTVRPAGLPIEGSEATFAKTVDTFNDAKLTKKKLFVWFEFHQVASENDEPQWSGEFTNASNQAIVDGTRKTIASIPAVEEGEEVYVAFKAFAYVSTPSSVWWTETDGVTFTLTFSFSNAEVATLQGMIEKDEELFNDAESPRALRFAEDMETPSDMESTEDAEPSDDDAEPSEDTEPVEEAQPILGTAIVETPEPVDDAEPSEDTEPVEEAQPVLGRAMVETPEPVDDAEPSEDTEPVEEAQPVLGRAMLETPEPVEDAEPSEDTEPVEEAQPVLGRAMVETPEPVEDAEPSENTEPVEEAQPVLSTAMIETPEPVDDAEPSEDTEPVEEAQPVLGRAMVETPEPVEDAEPSEDTEPVEEGQPVLGTAMIETPEPVEDAEPSNMTQPIDNAQSSDVAEHLEDTQPSDVTEPVEEVELSDATEPVESAEPSDVTEPVEDTEPSDDTEPIENTEPSEVAKSVEDTAESLQD